MHEKFYFSRFQTLGFRCKNISCTLWAREKNKLKSWTLLYKKKIYLIDTYESILYVS